MARMSGIETIVSSARSESRSLRTTIPVFVVEQIGLKEGDHLNWRVEKENGGWTATIQKQ